MAKHSDLKDDLKQLASKYNVSEIAGNWFLGGAIINRDMAEQLELVCVNKVICVAEECVEQDMKSLRKSDCDLYSVEWTPALLEPVKPVEDFLATWAWVRAQIEDSILSGDEFPYFFVHCNAGLHRGPVMLAFLLAALTGCSFEHMVDYIQSRRPYIEVDEVTGLRASAKRALATLGITSDSTTGARS